MEVKQTQLKTFLQEMYKAAFALNPNLMYIFDPDKQQRLDVNQAFVEISGYTREELLGAKLPDTVLWRDSAALFRMYNFPGSSQKSTPLITNLHTRSGAECRIALSACRIQIEDTTLLTLTGNLITEDLTAYQTALQELTHSEDKFALAFHNNPDIMVISSPEEGRLLEVNTAFLTNLGYQQAEVIGKSSLKLNLWESPQQRDLMIRELEVSGSCHNLEMKIRTRKGELITVLLSATRVELATGPVVLSVVKDISARKKAEELLKMQRDLSVALQEFSGRQQILEYLLRHCLQIEDIDAGGVYLVEENALRLVVHSGLSPGFVESSTYYTAESPQAKLVLQGNPLYLPYSQLQVPKSGTRIEEGLQSFAMIPVKYENRVIACLNLASHKYHEIPATVRHLLESIAGLIGGTVSRADTTDKLQESEQKFRLLFERIADGILIVETTTGKFMEANPAICRLLGYTAREMLQLKLRDIHPPEQLDYILAIFQTLVRGENTLAADIPCLTKTGQIVYVDINATPVTIDNRACLIGIFRNVTQRQLLAKLEQEQQIRRQMLLRTQRLTSLGELTTALAHEIRQPLHVMKMLSEGMLYWKKKDPQQDPRSRKHRENLGKILKGIDRIEGVIDNVYRSTRGSRQLKIEEVDFNLVAGEIASFFQQKIKDHGIDLNLDLDPAAQVVPFSRLQAEQIITNLLSNAIMALDTVDKTSKTIHLLTKEQTAYLLLEISDNGPGIKEEIIEQIFNPLFTTHQDKENLGMGLYIVHNILESFKATITVRNNPPGGALFRIKLFRKETGN